MLNRIVTGLIVLLFATAFLADGMVFGIAGKRIDDNNFIMVWKSYLLAISSPRTVRSKKILRKFSRPD